jgi:hypothetical protein
MLSVSTSVPSIPYDNLGSICHALFKLPSLIYSFLFLVKRNWVALANPISFFHIALHPNSILGQSAVSWKATSDRADSSTKHCNTHCKRLMKHSM